MQRCSLHAGGGSAKAFHTLGEAFEKSNIYFDVIDDAFVPEGATLPEDVKGKLTGFVVDHGVTADMSLEEAVESLQKVMMTGDAPTKDSQSSTGELAGCEGKGPAASGKRIAEKHVIKPTAVCENDKLRFMKRNMADGSCIYFVFNESKDTQSAKLMLEEWRACSCSEVFERKEGCVHFEQDAAYEALQSAMSCYRLYPEDGRIEKWSDLNVTLPMGDTAVFLFTKEVLDAKVPLGVSKEVPVDGCFTLEKAKEFRITREGIQTKEYTAGVDNEQAEKRRSFRKHCRKNYRKHRDRQAVVHQRKRRFLLH